MIKFKPSFGSAVNGLLANGADACGLKIGLRVSWKESEQLTRSNDFVITDDFVKTMYSTNKAVQLTLKGLAEFSEVKAELIILSNATNVDWTSEEKWTVK